MLDPIDGINKLIGKSALPKTGSNVSGTQDSSVSPPPIFDLVDVNSDSLLDSFRSQAGALKNELPGLIAQSLLAPVTDQAIRREPLNALLFRLENPLDSILGQLPLEDIPENLILGLQEEIRKLQGNLLSLRDHAILAQFSSDLSKADPLNDILVSLSDRLGALGARVGQLL